MMRCPPCACSNWMGAKLEDDDFGKAMLASGIPKDTIMTWTKDPQVEFDGKKASLFDLLEDLDYDDCLAKSQSIAGVSGSRPSGKMQAYVFLKPHAVRTRRSRYSSSWRSAGSSSSPTTGTCVVKRNAAKSITDDDPRPGTPWPVLRRVLPVPGRPCPVPGRPPILM